MLKMPRSQQSAEQLDDDAREWIRLGDIARQSGHDHHARTLREMADACDRQAAGIRRAIIRLQC